MTDVRVQVDGLREMTRSLEKAGAELDDLKDVFSGIAATASAQAQQLTPRASGALKASVRPNRAKNKSVVTFGSARVKYAGPILYGWPARGITASRTIPRTDAYMADRAPQMLEEGLRDVFRKIGIEG